MLIPAHMEYDDRTLTRAKMRIHTTSLSQHQPYIISPTIMRSFFDCYTSFCPLTHFHPLPPLEAPYRPFWCRLIFNLITCRRCVPFLLLLWFKQKWHWLPCHIFLPVVLMTIPAAGKRRDSPYSVHLIRTVRCNDNDDIQHHPWYSRQPLKKLWNGIITMCK